MVARMSGWELGDILNVNLSFRILKIQHTLRKMLIHRQRGSLAILRRERIEIYLKETYQTFSPTTISVWGNVDKLFR